MIFQEEKICLFSSQYWDFHWKWLFLAKHIFDQLEHTDLIGLNIKELQNPTVICGHRKIHKQLRRSVDARELPSL